MKTTIDCRDLIKTDKFEVQIKHDYSELHNCILIIKYQMIKPVKLVEKEKMYLTKQQFYYSELKHQVFIDWILHTKHIDLTPFPKWFKKLNSIRFVEWDEEA